MKLVITFFMFLGINSAFAQATSEAAPITDSPAATSEQSIWDRIKNAPIGLMISNDTSTSNPNGKVNGFSSTTDLFLSYKLTDHDSLRVNTTYSVSDTTASTIQNSYEGTTLRYKRSGLLSKDKHGVDMSADIRYNLFSLATKTAASLAGSTSLRVAVIRSFSPVFSNYFELRWDEYTRTASTPSISRRKFLVTTAPSYQVTDKLSLNAALSFTQAIKGEGAKHSNYISFAPDITYAFTDKFNGTIYWDTSPMASNDQVFFRPGWVSNGALGLALTYSIL